MNIEAGLPGKVLILGKGFIGSNLYKYISRFFDVYIINKAQVDYTDCDVLTQYINDKGPYQFIINASGYTGRPNVDACEDHKKSTWLYNVIVPVNIHKVCKATGHKLIHISSGCIYDGHEKEFTEEDEPNFGLFSEHSSWYSKSKHAAEMMLKDEEVYIFRIRIPFCEEHTHRNYLTKLINYDNIIDQQNSMTCVEDFMEFIMLFMLDIIEDNQEIPYGIYNVVNPGALKTYEIVKMLEHSSVLSDNKLQQLNLDLPEAYISMQACIVQLAKEIDVTRTKKSNSKQTS